MLDENNNMHRALHLASQGRLSVAPNPMVGCVIACGGKIVSEGFHEKYGEAHAEVNAIKKMPEGIDPSHCTLYVSLEPCSHYGKTPPCADLIIEKGFKKVAVCNMDPNPLVAGKGIQKLREKGIEVTTGILEEKGRELNKRFFTFHEKRRPYIILKWAQTADGFVSRFPIPDNREENMISTLEQLKEGHRLRAESMAILVGKNTVLADNPSLTTRYVNGKNPLRLFIDRNLEVPSHFRIYDEEAPTIVFNSTKEGRNGNIRYCKLDFTENIPEQICSFLYRSNVQSLLVEGGPFLLESFFDKKLYDEIKILRNPDVYFKSGLKGPKI
jgi:diaminohydroxyphosphoribosylaminopyrimidine deaminase / 5-amino-6-(5-phosphoribosylamino)uracil reductase